MMMMIRCCCCHCCRCCCRRRCCCCRWWPYRCCCRCAAFVDCIPLCLSTMVAHPCWRTALCYFCVLQTQLFQPTRHPSFLPSILPQTSLTDACVRVWCCVCVLTCGRATNDGDNANCTLCRLHGRAFDAGESRPSPSQPGMCGCHVRCA